MSTELAPQTFVALTPYELPAAQSQVATWCQAKIHALARDLREQRSNLRQAKAMHWKRTGWANAITKTKKLMVYYTKIKQAVSAGYLIIPNFNVDVIAVRVQEGARPPGDVGVHLATPQVLPPGEGHYVDDRVDGYYSERSYTDSAGKPRTTNDFIPTNYDTDLDFPAALVKPSILEATNRAMAKQLFDRIGIIRAGKRADPIVVGQIIHPKTSGGTTLRNWPTVVTFFIAWWLSSEDL